MRSRVTSFRAIFLAAILAFFLSRAAFAFQGGMGVHYIIPPDRKVEGDLYLVGWRVDVRGTVNGDLFVLGGVVHIEGAVHGNVYLSGAQVQIDGPVTGDVNIISLNGESTGACRACRIMALDADEEGSARSDVLELAVLASSIGNVAGDTVVGAEQVSVAGKHAGRLLVAGKKVTVSGLIEGLSDVKAGDLVFAPSAKLAGGLYYMSPDKYKGKPERLDGGVEHEYPPPQFIGEIHFPWLYTLLHRFLSAVWLTVVGLFAVTTWLKRPSRSIIDAMLDYPWECFGIGLILCAAIPGIGIVLIVSVLGLPLGFIMLGLFAIGVYITRLFASLYLGERVLQILEHHRPPYWQSLPIGVLIFTVLTSIPLVGIAASLVTIPLAFGAKFVAGRKFYRENPELSIPA